MLTRNNDCRAVNEAIAFHLQLRTACL